MNKIWIESGLHSQVPGPSNSGNVCSIKAPKETIADKGTDSQMHSVLLDTGSQPRLNRGGLLSWFLPWLHSQQSASLCAYVHKTRVWCLVCVCIYKSNWLWTREFLLPQILSFQTQSNCQLVGIALVHLTDIFFSVHQEGHRPQTQASRLSH